MRHGVQSTTSDGSDNLPIGFRHILVVDDVREQVDLFMLRRQLDSHGVSARMRILTNMRLHDTTVLGHLKIMPRRLLRGKTAGRFAIQPHFYGRPLPMRIGLHIAPGDPHPHPHPCALAIPSEQILMVLTPTDIHAPAVLHFCDQHAAGLRIAGSAVHVGQIAAAESRLTLLWSLLMVIRAWLHMEAKACKFLFVHQNGAIRRTFTLSFPGMPRLCAPMRRLPIPSTRSACPPMPPEKNPHKQQRQNYPRSLDCRQKPQPGKTEQRHPRQHWQRYTAPSSYATT